MRRRSIAKPGTRSGGTQWVRGIAVGAERGAVGRLDGRRVARGGARVRRLGQLGDVVEVDVVFGAVGGSHYGLQNPAVTGAV
jgi:hypothetical protein